MSPSFPKSSPALGETEGRGCGKGGGFLGGLARRLSRVRSASVFHVTSPLNRSIPDASRFLRQSSPEPVAMPVQEERDASSGTPSLWGGCTTRGPSHPGQAKPRPGGCPHIAQPQREKQKVKPEFRQFHFPRTTATRARESPESAVGSREPCSVLCDRGVAAEQSWGWPHASAAPRSTRRGSEDA